MALEIVEEALVYNTTRRRPNTLTVRFEDFAPKFDATVRRVFAFLDSRGHIDTLAAASAQFDLTKQPADDQRHVSSSADKQPLRDKIMADPLLRGLIGDLRVLLGYAAPLAGASPTRTALCERLRDVCATTRVGFFPWCSYGRVPRGRVPSLWECGGEDKPAAKPGG